MIFVQELAREEHGWNSFETESFQWITHRAEEQWRGVGVGISLDRFDSIVHKFSTKRGIWLVARLRGVGRVLLGSLHCHTGTTNAVYQEAVIEFAKACPRRFRHLPLVCGVDANEVPTWSIEEETDNIVAAGSSNLNLLLTEFTAIGASAQPPREADLRTPTHYPRDESRRGRQIDMIFARMVHLDRLHIEPERRHSIGSDHAIASSNLLISEGNTQHKWGNDSRPRWVSRELPETACIVDEDDLRLLAKNCTSRTGLRRIVIPMK